MPVRERHRQQFARSSNAAIPETLARVNGQRVTYTARPANVSLIFPSSKDWPTSEDDHPEYASVVIDDAFDGNEQSRARLHLVEHEVGPELLQIPFLHGLVPAQSRQGSDLAPLQNRVPFAPVTDTVSTSEKFRTASVTVMVWVIASCWRIMIF